MVQMREIWWNYECPFFPYGSIWNFRYSKGRSTKVYAKDVFEKPKLGKTPSYTAIIGRYILKKTYFLISLINLQVGGEIQLTDSIKAMIPQEGLCGFRLKESSSIGGGTKEGWLEANLAFAWSDPTFTRKLRLC